MSARLLYVMDPMCSWCWGFAPVAEALVEQAQAAGVELHLVVGGLRTGSGAALEPATRRYILEHWQAVTDATGQTFKRDGALPEGFVYDTEPACRAIVTARSLAPDCAWKLLGLIQRAFYVEGRDVTLASVLVELAETAGIPRIGFAGFPTLLAERNGQLALLTNGYQPLSALSPLLARWLERAACA